jgi:uncharacterized membrane protein
LRLLFKYTDLAFVSVLLFCIELAALILSLQLGYILYLYSYGHRRHCGTKRTCYPLLHNMLRSKKWNVVVLPPVTISSCSGFRQNQTLQSLTKYIGKKYEHLQYKIYCIRIIMKCFKIICN